MNRIAAALFALTLAGCAHGLTPQQEAINARADEGAQVYQNLQLTAFEQQMIPEDKRLTYGFAVVNCGLRDTQWMDILRYAYARDYQIEWGHHPLTPVQTAQAEAYAEAHIADPSPPPYICSRLSRDSFLPDLDYTVAAESLLLASEKRKAG